MIHQIVDRCHVDDSNRKVIRYVISRLRKGYDTYHAMPKAQRRELMTLVIEAHRENRELYRAVMR